MQLMLLQNNEQEQPTTKTCLAPDTSKAEVERVQGMCALGNKKNVLSLVLTAAWGSDSVLRGHSAFPLPLLLWDSFLSPTRCLHFCRSLGFEPQGLIYPVKVLSFNYELELSGFFLPKGKDAPSQRSECLGLRKTSCVEV